MQFSEVGQPVVFAQTLARSLEKQNVKTDKIHSLYDAGGKLLDPESTTFNFQTVALFFEHAASMMEDPILGFRAGREQDFRAAGHIAYIALSSETLAEFLYALVRYLPLFSKDLKLSVKANQRVVFENDAPEEMKKCQFTEFFLTLLVQSMRRYTGRHIAVSELTFRHAAPENYSEMRRFFDGPITFGASFTSVLLPPAVLTWPLLGADPYLHRLLCALGDNALSSIQTDRPRFVVRVEQELQRALPSGEVSQHNLACQLGMSVRTLSRRLAQHGTSYFALLDQMRHNMAISYLSEGELKLTEIATALGYASLGSFSDAFKRWTGQTPGQFRGIFRR
ncbi:AraC family transcriptional regulator [Epibacterium ulvae]|uniref:AraC family transcriptional regulator n=1 Tax=Epibacterium ulvae TaxID=1156985 RepID=UPI0024918FC2|nr:AraC family transcriptional regulator [Epibacterium ulvae]